MSINSKLTAIANAIREKTDKTGKLTLDDMAAEIKSMVLAGGTIIVKAPRGSKVTISKDGATKTAAEDNGTWTFLGCGVGMWSVKVDNNGEIKNGIVNIYPEEPHSISLFFDLRLFENGVFGDAGTLIKYAGSGKNPTIVNNQIEVSSSFMSSGNFGMENTVDITPYSKFAVNFADLSGDSGDAMVTLYCNSATTFGGKKSEEYKVRGNMELNVLDQTGQMYLGFKLYNAAASYIDSITLVASI